MLDIIDEIFDINSINDDDLFICSVGHEERSYFLLEKIRKKIDADNILVFKFDRLIHKVENKSMYEEICIDSFNTVSINYNEYEMFLEKVFEFISNKRKQMTRVYIDYSFMPRMFYCNLPFGIKEKFDDMKVYFLYSEGSYEDNYLEYPCAGIDSLIPYSGKASLRCNLKRTHIFSLSYDAIRTEGLLSMLDPESIITCSAYDPEYADVYNNISNVNKSIISRSKSTISFHIDNFSFMVAKICEVATEHLPIGDVVIIPDGPKPLIFALSIAGKSLSHKHGITCMQIIRNNLDDSIVDVKPNGKVISFSI